MYLFIAHCVSVLPIINIFPFVSDFNTNIKITISDKDSRITDSWKLEMNRSC